MAEDLTGSSPAQPGPAELPPASEPAVPATEQPKQLVTRPARSFRERRYGWRFLLAYAILGVFLAAGVGGFALLTMSGAGDGDGGDDEGWSHWRPTARGEAGVDQIASFVGNRYRLPSGRQLVAVVADRPLVQNEIPVSTVAIENGSPDSQSDQNYTIHDTGGDYMYVLCGLGENCAIREGTPSVERHRLLRREALELALYTFRYVDGVDSIIAFMPPRLGEQPSNVLYFRKSDLEEYLSRPLRETLPSARAPKMDRIPAREKRVIDQLTTKNLFQYEFTQGPDASAILVLTPQFPRN
jgi:hypothetical protein